jgi:hypothetical protein
MPLAELALKWWSVELEGVGHDAKESSSQMVPTEWFPASRCKQDVLAPDHALW